MSSNDIAKVTSSGLRRDAYFYIRQSTLYQVVERRRVPTGQLSAT